VTVLEIEAEVTSLISDDQYVAMTSWQDDELSRPGSETRRRYLEALRAHARKNPPPIAFPVRPVIGRGQTEKAPEEISAIVPPYNRPRRHR
jgi:hypothetical protein